MRRPVIAKEPSVDSGIEHRFETSDGLPILEEVDGAVLTDDDVRRLREDLQR